MSISLTKHLNLGIHLYTYPKFYYVSNGNEYFFEARILFEIFSNFICSRTVFANQRFVPLLTCFRHELHTTHPTSQPTSNLLRKSKQFLFIFKRKKMCVCALGLLANQRIYDTSKMALAGRGIRIQARISDGNGTRWQCCSAYDMIMNVQFDIQGI